MVIFHIRHCIIFILLFIKNCQAQIDKKDEEALYKFRSTMSEYFFQPTDLVFLLDESGSVGIQNWPTETLFTQLITRMFKVGPNDTRIAVITFSTNYIIHFNYISSADGTMCNSLDKTEKIDYKGGWTNTNAGFISGGEVLSKGRKNVNKLIVLLSDGEYNRGGDPEPTASTLRNKGYIIFSVGVANAQRSELLKYASTEDHLYIIKDFEYIRRVNENLRKDIKNDFFVKVSDKSLCCKSGSTCCDVNADCSCGLDGEYSCACHPGYYGIGLKGKCHKCPKGTYNEEAGQEGCTPCPVNSVTAEEGSTSKSQCKCKEGYQGSTGFCSPIKCPILRRPYYGEIYPDNCGNTVDTKCSFSCKDPYCPYDGTVPNCAKTMSRKKLGERVCQSNGRWSGRDFICDIVKCPILQNPPNGYFVCSNKEYGDDRSFKAECSLKCSQGYNNFGGTKILKCLNNGTWSGVVGKCKAVTCTFLKPRQNLLFKPENCTKGVHPFQTVCQQTCVKGLKYERLSGSYNVDKLPIGQRRCDANGLWFGEKEEMYKCKDITPPNIVCPAPIVANTTEYRKRVKWQIPKATDNHNVKKTQLIYPKYIKKPPFNFQIGKTKLVYEAIDTSNLKATCTFTVTIIDCQPPIVKYCPEDKEVVRGQTDAVRWKSPKFVDNSRDVKIIYQSHTQGDSFPTGKSVLVHYKASDSANNIAECKFYIKLKSYPCPYLKPPVNGILTCINHTNEEICSVSCDDGYDFLFAPIDSYICDTENNVNQWKFQVIDGKSPWPDCGEVVAPTTASADVQVKYRQNDCNNITAQEKALEQFLEKLKNKNPILAKLCKDATSCNFKNVHLNCEDQNVEINSRSKRETSKHSVMSLDFEFEISINSTDEKHSEELKQMLNEELSKFLDQLLSGNSSISADEMSFSEILSPPVIKDIRINCDVGHILKNNSCVKCPVGTYYHSTTLCKLCPYNTYQDEEASLECKRCPSEMVTNSLGAVAIVECVSSCKPGTYSVTGYEQCTACDIGYYQPSYQQTDCLKCAYNTTTWIEGSTTEDECSVPCQKGFISPTGMEPCTPCPYGTYQSAFQMTDCISCPNNLTTIIEGATNEDACQDFDLCDPNPCENNGNCTSEEVGEIVCECLSGYEGEKCEVNIDDCNDTFCLNNGTCVDGIDSYHCTCQPGFIGDNCEINIDDCFQGACINGGTCIDGINSYHCECPEGLAGDKCEIVLKNCDSDTCMNGGTCFDVQKSFRCCCPSGFSGYNCEINDDECQSNPCFNGGICTDGINQFTCSCLPGFKGKRCEVNINDCNSSPCLNNATCVDLVNDFKCLCHTGFGDKLCSLDLASDFDFTFSEVAITNLVKIKYEQELYAVTVSFWMQAWPDAEKKLRGTPVSFAYKSPITKIEEANALTWYDFNKFIIHLHGTDFQTTVTGTSDKNWHHYALTWDSSDGSWIAYKDGIQAAQGSNAGKGIPLWRGVIVLGQEQDSVGGGFSVTEAFMGKISQFNVWNFVMKSEEIKSLNESCDYAGNIIAWVNIINSIEGNVAVSHKTDLCKTRGSCKEKNKRCFCPKSKVFDDSFCQKNIVSCSSGCQNGGICRLTNNGAFCDCISGTEGRYCQYDINECAFNNGNCSHTCRNSIGSYVCECPTGFYLKEDGHTCETTSHCTYEGLLYGNQEQWNDTRLCQQCTCDRGIVRCNRLPCVAETECSNNERMLLMPGECCKRCIKTEATCRIQRTNEYTTFDGANFMFTSTCRYLLAQDCSMGTFAVYISNDQHNTKKKQLIVSVSCIELRILPNGLVLINNHTKNIPYFSPDVNIVRSSTSNFGDSSSSLNVLGKSTESIVMTLSEGIIIVWNKNNEVFVSLPEHFKMRMCGLCGNFNGRSDDDFMTRSYLKTESITDFILNWRINPERHCPEPSYQPNGKPVLEKNAAICQQSKNKLQKANKLCAPLRMFPFHLCYEHVNPQPYHTMCIQDVCMSSNTSILQYCISLKAYILACQRHGIIITGWKKEKECASLCPSGMVFDDCGPQCPPSCTEQKDFRCQSKSCKIGCRCEDGLLFEAGKCMHPSHCPNALNTLIIN